VPRRRSSLSSGTTRWPVLLAHRQTDPPPLPDDVPRPVADLVRRLLAKDPADRPASARQVQQEAATLRRGLPTGTALTAPLHAPPVPSAARPPAASRPAPLGLAGRPGQRRAVRATALALGLLAVALGVRDARDDSGSTSDVRRDRPASSAPPAPVPTQEPSAEQPTQEEQREGRGAGGGG
jgi:serine/threonine-protein kinase